MKKQRHGAAAGAPISKVAAAVCGMLALAVAIVFCQTARHEFLNFDDNVYVTANEHVKNGVTPAAIAWAFTTYEADNWHPLTWLSHMLDCEIYGIKPAGHHLTGAALHAATAILLFLTLRRMTGALWPSAWAAAVFAIHPLRAESVAWLAERKDVLGGLLFVLTLWLYARYAERPSWGRYAWVVTVFALGLMAKPMLVTLPFVLPLLDYWPLQRVGRKWGVASGKGEVGSDKCEAASGKAQGGTLPASHLPLPTSPIARLVAETLPLLLLAAISCWLTLSAHADPMKRYERLAFAARAANATLAYVAYLGKMVCPMDLAVLYPLPKTSVPRGEVLAAAGLLLAATAAAIAARRRWPFLFVGWFWYLGTLAP